MNLPSLEWVFESLESWMRNASVQEQEAMGLFLDALSSTQKYLGRLQRDMSFANIESEHELSDAWNAAAKAVRKYDYDLYQRCLAKACHWTGSNEFRGCEISKLNISIEKMISIASSKKRA
ncbi:hypothetical protein HWQ46_03205 [Shewanella sp. D64]|uniref:hypothetical protein n=1 Tax=unclassified Shewanella TaxID=196818 RepID=UPI0022BA6DF4|nr:MULTISPECIES: hypothetical protein [unclassified Shewanella]MEC4724555.1 hypothetical protein [Shewanella sp. D64]MEC4736668.1 hypothetical protein [Shewanella sp. E94]WBJ94662.1 hypothetical protein HWQ47_22845 [Shewanella sp. MTB7]